jgi:hypothetical protein
MNAATRYAVAAALLLLALAAWSSSSRPAPGPPIPAGELELRGKFVGPTAAADAAGLAALCAAVADCLEADGQLPTPHLTTATAFDQLRTRARELTLRGQSLGDRHPRARDAIGAYLEARLGTAGGPVTPETRAAWIAAYRVIAEAAAHAAR